MATFSNFKSTLVAAADTAAGASSAATTVVADMAALIALTGMSDGDQAFVTANNNLYFYSSGWYKIATVVNDSPSSITGVSGSYDLDSGGGTTTITAVSTDPEGFPLTWSYSTSGLGSIATISQADNVFTITPSTNSANAGSFTLTISATDGINGAVSASSTLSLTFFITNSKYTTALITAVDTSDNNNITDASSNNHTVTVTGDTVAGTFSPYRHGGYSTYFDGTGDYITIADDASLDVGTGDFTIEAWIYLTSNDDSWNISSHSSSGGIWFGAYPPAGLVFRRYGVGDVIATTPPSIKTWHHIAVARSSGQTRMFINGTQVESTVADNNDYSVAASWYIGDDGDGATQLMTGYIRDFRLVKGTGLYTANFTPPTEPLTAVANTSILACHLPYIADGSSNNHTITPSGNVKTEARSPYNNSPYSANSNGGSVYFDGTGDYLQINNSTDFAFGTGDFTVEAWVNYTTWSGSGGQAIISTGTSTSAGAAGHWYLTAYGATDLRFGRHGAPQYTSVTSSLSVNSWNHIAVTREGTTLRIFINGVSLTTSDTGGGIGSYDISNSSGYLYIGEGASFSAASGHISDVRIIKGTASYTSNFTPPTSLLSSSGATLHVKGTDASIIDKSQGTNLVLPSSGVSGSTTQVKFASTKSIYFTGGSSAGVNLGTNLFLDALNTEYTLEMWYYPTQTGTDSFLMSSYISSSTGRWMLYQQGTDSRIRFFGNLNGTREVFTTAVSANNWYHVAVVRKSNGYISIFLNGTETELAVNLSGYATVLDRPVLLGSGDTFSTSGCQGYIQDVRITKGLARYTSNFTPPTSELTG